MKKTTSLSVDGFDFDIWKPYPHYEEFNEKYSAYKENSNGLDFYFPDEEEQITEEAKGFLDKHALKYFEGFSVQPETDEEMKNYPVVSVSFSTSKYPIVLEKKGKTYIGPKANKKNFQYDIYSGNKLVLSKKAKDFFEANIPGIQFEEVFDAAGKHSWYLAEGFTTLQYPRIYPAYTTVKPGAKGGFFVSGDGKWDYPDELLICSGSRRW